MKAYTTDSNISNPSSDLLGGKGYGLWEMSKLGLPVPPAVIIPPAVCRAYAKDPEKVMAWVDELVIPKVNEYLYTKLGGHAPLISVRSGAKVSMPGMMDTVLNVGLDDTNIFHYTERLGEACYEDCRLRLVEMYSDVVMGIPRHEFAGCNSLTALKRYWTLTKEPFPDRETQLLRSIEAVFKSWNNPRAVAYRALNGIPHKAGTAVILQAMVYGNSGENSLTGVVFSRNPNTGDDELFGEYMVNAQGEDIVAGIRTPQNITAMEHTHPEAYTSLLNYLSVLEQTRKDMQDVEFTLDNGKLWILQTRSGKRTSLASLRIALDLHFANEIDFDTLCERVSLEDYLNVTRPKLAPGAPEHTGEGIAASTGIAVGRAVFTSAAALKCSDPCILIAKETTPEDITGMAAAAGILTVTGGATSHAAVVARGMNTPAIVGATHLEIQGELAAGIDGVHKIDVGDWVTLDGNTGRFWLGQALPVEKAATHGSAYVLTQLLRDHSDALRIARTYKDFGSTGCLIPAGVVEANEFIQMVSEMESGVIDLRSTNALTPEAANIADMFGGVAGEEERLMNLLDGCLFPANSKIMLILGGVPLTANMQENGDLSVIPTVSTLEEMLLATGEAFYSPTASKISPVALMRLNLLKEAANEKTSVVTLSASSPDSLAKTDMQLLQENLA